MKIILFLLLAALPLRATTTQLALVPLPASVTTLSGSATTLDSNTQILYLGTGAKEVANLLAESLRSSTKLPLPVSPFHRSKTKNSLSLIITTTEKNPNPESYTLKSQNGQTQISAPSSRGLFNATQTLAQLIPLNSKTIPAVEINDSPAYQWRGMMLDVSRYFFTKKYVLRYLDMMAMHKMNVLHWHLIDDAGWRIEIKKYPKLTEVGAWRGTGDKKYGGFYTQQDIKEIVAYATARNITIVPEIELPAHTLPALAAYPHLGCFNKKFVVPTRHSISPELYCAGKDTTWIFLEDVFTEICDLFPGTYIHIGGDEARFQRWNKCPDCQKKIKEHNLKNSHQLQGWMTTQVEKFLESKGKRIIGWEEILGAGVTNKAGIMTWYRPQTAIKAAQRGNPVVMSPTAHAYFDVAESKLPGEPPAATWLSPISLQKAYEWEPTPKSLTGKSVKNILGASGCIWSDQFLHKAEILADKPGKGTYASEAYIDYLSLPRMAALAEVCWTPENLRNKGGFQNFSQRMRPIYARYTQRGYQYRIPVPNIQVRANSDKTYTLTATAPTAGGSIRYTLDSTAPTSQSSILDGSLTTAKIHQFRAATFPANESRHSLLFKYIATNNAFAKFGTKFGNWKSGQIGNKNAKEITFDATGHINSNGTYIITFIYTGGKERLDIDGISVVRNDTTPVGKDIHHGFTGANSKNNSYTIKVSNYQTGASFKIKALIYGHEGNDSNGILLIRKK